MGHLGARVAQWDRSLDLTTRTSLSPIRRGFAPGFVNYKKGCFRLAAASDKVYQLLAHGRWFSPGTPASSTTQTGRHDIVEILLNVALKHQRSMKSIIMGHLSSVVHEHFILKTIAHTPLDQLVPNFINAIWVFSLILKISVAISDIFVMLKIIFAQWLGPNVNVKSNAFSQSLQVWCTEIQFVFYFDS